MKHLLRAHGIFSCDPRSRTYALIKLLPHALFFLVSLSQSHRFTTRGSKKKRQEQKMKLSFSLTKSLTNPLRNSRYWTPNLEKKGKKLRPKWDNSVSWSESRALVGEVELLPHARRCLVLTAWFHILRAPAMLRWLPALVQASGRMRHECLMTAVSKCVNKNDVWWGLRLLQMTNRAVTVDGVLLRGNW